MAHSHSTEYRPITGFPGYRVGNDGSVWTAWKKDGFGGKGFISEEWRKMKPNARENGGHLRVNLCCDGKVRTRFVHRLVLEAFVGSCPRGQCCRHFPDQDPTNNSLENIQWGTPLENAVDRKTHGNETFGERHGMSKLSEEQVREIRTRYAAGGVFQRELGEEFGVRDSMISLIVNEKNWKHLA